MGRIPERKEMKTLVSQKWKVIPLEKQKLLKSFGWGILALIALVLAEYLTLFELPEAMRFFAPFVPVVVNFLMKWGRENTYQVK